MQESLRLAFIHFGQESNMSPCFHDANEKTLLGSQSYAVKVPEYGFEAILDGFGTVAENATAVLVKKANKRPNDLIIAASNRPTNVTIRLPSKRTLYRLETGDFKKGQDYECKDTERHFDLSCRCQDPARGIRARISL